MAKIKNTENILNPKNYSPYMSREDYNKIFRLGKEKENVTFKDVFEFIKQQAEQGGLTVKMESGNIMFISHKEALLESLEEMLKVFGPIADAYDEKELRLKVESAIKKAKGTLKT